jgi:Sec-independent protein secretion pathway component TatC
MGDSLRHLVQLLTQQINREFQSTLGTKIIAFVIFIVCICFAYLALCLPFVVKMSKDVR